MAKHPSMVRKGQMGIRRWATRSLRTGDLTALSKIAKGSSVDDPNRIDRLRKRGFVTAKIDGRPEITLPGRLALAAKNIGMVSGSR